MGEKQRFTEHLRKCVQMWHVRQQLLELSVLFFICYITLFFLSARRWWSWSPLHWARRWVRSRTTRNKRCVKLPLNLSAVEFKCETAAVDDVHCVAGGWPPEMRHQCASPGWPGLSTAHLWSHENCQRSARTARLIQLAFCSFGVTIILSLYICRETRKPWGP